MNNFKFQFISVIGLLLISFQNLDAQKKLSLDDIFKNSTFKSSSIPGYTPMNDGEHYLVKDNNGLNIYDYKTGKKQGVFLQPDQLIPTNDTNAIRLGRFTLSNDETKLLIPTQTEQIYRRSSKSNYYLCDLNTHETSLLSENGKQQHATFSPNGLLVAFVRDNNLFIKDLVKDRELQITIDGEQNKIINGATDWVYEEEFSLSKAFFWSPDSKKIAYYRFDETEVKEFSMMIWGDLYPITEQYKYPKAGEANSLVEIKMYDIESGSVININIGDEQDKYIPRIKWTAKPNILAIQRLNRLQNSLEILLADANSGSSEVIYTEQNKCYIDITDDLTFLENSDQFIISSEQDGYNHLYLFDLLGNLEKQITSGEWDVDQFIGIDEKNSLVYYTSSESSPLNRELYVSSVDGSNKKKLSKQLGNNSANFSKKYNYYINTFSDANTPPQITLHDSKGNLLRTLEANEKLNNEIKEYNFSKRNFFSFTTSDSVILNGWMIKPPDFDSLKKYPVLMYVYGGPGSQTVRNSWGGGNTWDQYLAQHNIIIVSIDNRGTGARGEEFKKMTYLELGKYETIDQIEGAKYLGGLSYVDDQRIGIWGWSYGGFMAASCLTLGADYFSMGISVAPVTNWRYYDNIYTERFMRTPQENPDGYDNNSPINHADKLQGNLLLIHGTADDNVHIQNSMDFVTALVNANKQFEMQFYPNSNHGIYTGPNTRYHLYNRLTDFILEHLVKNEKN